MKKGVSLIELVFSIVVIGISLAAVPKIVLASLETDKTSYTQEYIYDLKEFYGLIRNLPAEDNNISFNEYKKNSLLSHFKPITFSPNVNYMHKDYINTLSQIDLQIANQLENLPAYKVQTIKNLEGKALTSSTVFNKDILGNNIENTIPANASIKIYKHPSNTQYNLEAKNILLLNQITLSVDKEELIRLHIPNTRLSGRIESIYPQYLLKSSDTHWKTQIEEKLKEYIN